MLFLPLRVLVLNDNFFQRTAIVNMVRRLGCDAVFDAASANHAWHVLCQVGPVDIVVCDLHKDGMENLDFLRRSALSGLVRSVIINNSLAEDVQRTARQLMPLLGLKMLGEVGSPFNINALSDLLMSYKNEPTPPAVSRCMNIVVSDEEVRVAIVEGQMETYFQPKVNLINLQVSGVEALTRWNHPRGGIVSPVVFMSTIERCELLNQLFFAQLEHGLHLQRQYLMHGQPLNVAFNLQPSQLSDVGLVSRIKETLASFKLPAAGVTFELTETGLVDASAECIENLLRLRLMGCRLSIDDFGSGFSSLRRLCQLPFNEIKLDGEFIQALDDGPRSRAVISSTIALGESLGMTVVAEGIETQDQHRELVKLGCVLGQGYFLGKPMKKQELVNWLQSRAPLRGSGR
ncbi:EAL domain-containing response regulator [Pseudomonas sp. A34-9]|uniref:EAL domain-containing response regulator n=1 Tax=Pseudomonas sp. A34-9 TaxID=3034675 RepID=UPI00240E8CE5|nr:EAL domain-containing response regulator [Pseudomonas sp. A34-9]